MGYFLALAGVLVLFLTGLALAAFWFYKCRIRRGYFYHLAAGINRFPQRLRLRRQEPFRWRKAVRAAKRVTALQALGFEEVAGYSIEEMSSAQLFVLRDPASGLVGIVNESDELGTWTDILLFPGREGASPILASNILSAAHFRCLPGDPKIHRPEVPAEELVEAVQQAASMGTTTRLVTADNFPNLYEEAFAEATDARLLEPMEDRQIRRLAAEHGALGGDEVSDKEFSAIKKLLPLAIENELRLACGAQFLRETTLSATEWQRATGRLLVIHERTPLRDLLKPLVQGAFLTKPMKKALRRAGSSESPRAAFARLNDLLPPWARYKRLGEVHRPVAADIYRPPIEPKGGAW